MKLILTLLVHATAMLSLVMSGSFLVRVKKPWQMFLSGPKLVVGSLAAYLAAVGAAAATAGLLLKAPVAVFAGVLAALLSIRYVRRATAPHDDFDRVFGPEWQSRLPPSRQAKMLQKRWTWKQPRAEGDGSEPIWHRDVAFWTLPDSDRQLLCDIWLPPAEIKPSGLAFVYFHGSGWHWLDKDFGTRPLFRRLALQGHTVMDVAYRLCPETDIYGMVGDVKRAVYWMKHNASRYGVNPDRVVIGGGSAGGHLSLLTAYAPHHPDLTPDDVGDADLTVRAVVSWYGPTDLRVYVTHAGSKIVGTPKRDGEEAESPLPGFIERFIDTDLSRFKGQDFSLSTEEMMTNLLGGLPDQLPELYALASPVTHVHPDCPPTLLFQGEHDLITSADAVKVLHQKLLTAGVPAIYVEFPQTDHAFDIAILPEFSPAAQSAVYDVERFLALMADIRD